MSAAATIELDDVHRFLAGHLGADRFPDGTAGIIRPSGRPVRRIGLAIEPDSPLAAWAHEHALDVLILHRHWGLELDALHGGVSVLTYHLAFDDRLTLGYNPRPCTSPARIARRRRGPFRRRRFTGCGVGPARLSSRVRGAETGHNEALNRGTPCRPDGAPAKRRSLGGQA